MNEKMVSLVEKVRIYEPGMTLDNDIPINSLE